MTSWLQSVVKQIDKTLDIQEDPSTLFSGVVGLLAGLFVCCTHTYTHTHTHAHTHIHKHIHIHIHTQTHIHMISTQPTRLSFVCSRTSLLPSLLFMPSNSQTTRKTKPNHKCRQRCRRSLCLPGNQMTPHQKTTTPPPTRSQLLERAVSAAAAAQRGESWAAPPHSEQPQRKNTLQADLGGGANAAAQGRAKMRCVF